MKSLAKKIAHKILRWVDSDTRLAQQVDEIKGQVEPIRLVDKGTQILLALKYQELSVSAKRLPRFDEVEFRSFSQNGEDGILLYIFSLIGTTNKIAVEVCAGDGIECNSANLLIHHGWRALLFDGDTENIKRGQAFYANCRNTFLWPPTFAQAWVTRENINSLISEHGVIGTIDLLAVDLDGMDYWIWKAIDCIDPRVVVVEYNNLWSAEISVTVPYDPDFRAQHNDSGVDYGGASLAAFVKLAKQKGYRLVGVEHYGFNAFFIRSGIGQEIFPEIAAADCFGHPFAQHAMRERLPKVRELEWVEV